MIISFSVKGIFSGVPVSGGSVVSDVFHTEVAEDFKNSFSAVTEGNRAVMWEIVFEQFTAVESAHFVNSKYSDRAECIRCHGKNLPLRYISTENSVCGTLQTE